MRRAALGAGEYCNLERLLVYNPEERKLSMNWNKITLCSGLAVAVLAAPTMSAQGRPEARVSSPRANFAVAAPRANAGPSSRPNLESHGGRGGNWSNHGRGGNWQGHGGHRHHRHHRWHRHHRYPYFGYYPFGYGYPYFGSSASLYYNGYHPQYVQQNNGGGSVVLNVQQELARAGYYRGTIDGVIGQGTRNAIRSYERANGLRIDGRIDSELLSTMGLS